MVKELIQRWIRRVFSFTMIEPVLWKITEFFVLKVVQACAYTLGVDVSMIKIKASNALISPNDAPTGGSMASDGVAFVRISLDSSHYNLYFKFKHLSNFFFKATIECCKILLNRLDPIKKKNPGLDWPKLVAAASSAGIDLCCEFMWVWSDLILETRSKNDLFIDTSFKS